MPKSPSKRPKEPKPNELKVACGAEETEARALARAVLRPSVQAAVTLADYNRSISEVPLEGLIKELGEQIKAVQNGNVARSEAMLATQAHTLDAIFNSLARKAINAKYMDNLDRYLKLALKAQAQSRATWEALARVKNPPIAGYVGQANIAHGPQQVNNGLPVNAETSGPENATVQNKLLDQNDGERLDCRETGASVGADQGMATVEEIHGSEDGRGKGSRGAQCRQGRNLADAS